MNMLVDILDYDYLRFKEEGRMTHQGNWQMRLSKWMSRMVLSNNDSVSFLDMKDNDIFKETPLPREEEF